MNRRQRQLHCKRHLPPSREWSALTFEQRATVAQVHFRAGVRQVRCRCGEYVWPWQVVHEELRASELGWERGYVCEWLLKRRGFSVGCVVEWHNWHEARKFYQRKGRGVGYRIVHVGALADCARALVNACGGTRC